ncbi:MAG TPA: ADOP family duplicated permease [Gemmatimonadaceae bacterium]|nr:ADOP family duplicated permease [Gemmatimonadaceae bacterium]
MAEAKWRRYLRFWRSEIDADLDDELRFHFEQRIETLVASGLARDEAQQQALREFGEIGVVKQDIREIDRRVYRARQRAHRWENWRQDFGYATRSLLRAPGLSATIVVTLALGIGVNAMLFSLLDRLFLQTPPGVSNPAEVTRLYWQAGEQRAASFAVAAFSIPVVDAISENVRGIGATTVYQQDWQRFGNEEEPKTVVTMAGARYFEVVGVRPAFGRFFSAEEDRIDVPSPVAVVSESFWRRRFGESPANAIGQRISLNRRQLTVIGVVPSDFTGVDLNASDVWVPLGMLAMLSPMGQRGNGPPWYRLRQLYGFQLLVRAPLMPQGRLEAAATVAARRAFGDAPEGRNVRVLSGSVVAARGPGRLEQEASIAIRLGGVAVMVLLIACANVANLLLARAIRRRREIAIRSALGITRAGIVKLLLAESTVLAVAAGVAAMLIAGWAGSLLRHFLFPAIHWASGVIDWRVAIFTALVTLGTGVAAGLTAALRASRTDISQTLKTGGREGSIRGSRLRAVLLTVQVALSMVLLVGAVLFVKSLYAVRALDLGYDAERLVTLAPHYDEGDRKAHEIVLQTGLPELAARLAPLPGVEGVALASMSPMYGFSFSAAFYASGDTLPKWSDGVPNVTAVSPEYFATVGLRLVRGRNLTQSDVRTGGVAIVNNTLARSAWPHAEAIGQCLRIGKPSAPCVTVIGVVADARRSDVVEEPVRQVYLPIPRSGDYAPGYVIIRVAPDQAARIELVARKEAAAIFPGAEVSLIRLSDVLAPQYRPWELGATLFTVFGLLALLVTAVGVFSSLSHDVSQRRHELGVRAALGASLADIVGLVVGQGIRVVGVGALLGLLLALVGSRLVASLLYGVAPRDPWSIAIVVVILILVAAVASSIPAWRASRADPLEALRAD